MPQIDEPTIIRQGEEVDTARLIGYLKDNIKGLEGKPEIRQYPSGFSNLTYLVAFPGAEFILRRPPFGKKAKTAHDMSREFRMLSALKPVFPYCPRAVLLCKDESVIGSEFFVMERLKGIILRKDLPKSMTLGPVQARTLSQNLIRVLAELHSVDYTKIGLSDFARPEGYVKRQIEGWSRRYRDARTPDAPDYESVMSWLADKMPPDTDRPCVIHNDYKFDNVVLDPEDPLRITGVLDWEMSTIGDPLMDLGSSLGYWVEPNDPPVIQAVRYNATNVEGMLTRREQADLYSELTGRSIKAFDYYFIFGMFRLSVIAQQIYYRAYHGQTKDERLKLLIHVVRAVETKIHEIIEQSKL